MDKYPAGGAKKKKNDLFAAAQNPYAKKPSYEKKERQYAMPDPGKKVVTGDNVPVKMNKKGEYNLNFIDW